MAAWFFQPWFIIFAPLPVRGFGIGRDLAVGGILWLIVQHQPRFGQFFQLRTLAARRVFTTQLQLILPF